MSCPAVAGGAHCWCPGTLQRGDELACDHHTFDGVSQLSLTVCKEKQCDPCLVIGAY